MERIQQLETSLEEFKSQNTNRSTNEMSETEKNRKLDFSKLVTTEKFIRR